MRCCKYRLHTLSRLHGVVESIAQHKLSLLFAAGASVVWRIALAAIVPIFVTQKVFHYFVVACLDDPWMNSCVTFHGWLIKNGAIVGAAVLAACAVLRRWLWPVVTQSC